MTTINPNDCLYELVSLLRAENPDAVAACYNLGGHLEHDGEFPRNIELNEGVFTVYRVTPHRNLVSQLRAWAMDGNCGAPGLVMMAVHELERLTAEVNP